MLNVVEEFCTNHQHTIAALGALGTLAAVIVSLGLAWRAARANRTRLRASVDMLLVMHSTVDPKSPPRYVSVSITNTGNSALRLPFSFFSWKVPFNRDYWLVNPLDGYAGDAFIPQKRYPVEIQPRASETFYISDAQTFEEMRVKMRKETRGLAKLCIRFIRAVIRTDDGAIFAGTVSRGIRNQWRGSV